MQAITEDVRDDGDDIYFRQNLQYRIGFLGMSVADELVNQLVCMDRQIIFGDLSPKNIGISPSGELTTCDLESAHRGNAVFDAVFLLAHLLLHSKDDPVRTIEMFHDGYLLDDEELTIGLIVALMLYRIDPKFTPQLGHSYF